MLIDVSDAALLVVTDDADAAAVEPLWEEVSTQPDERHVALRQLRTLKVAGGRPRRRVLR